MIRLLECDDHGQVRLRKFEDDQIPAYAILSHTWLADNDQEVTFEDIVKQAYQGKDGYQKIDFSFKQAARHGLRYCWIDTCCIDKSSSQELSEALNSMFRWYRNAARCYVYLSDVCKDDSDHANVVSETWWREPFKKSRWFSRGWTLQELLAPTTLEFYSKEGSLLGTKSSLEREVNARTGIQLSALRGTTPLNQFSVTERRSWAEHRETKRPEDSAYCLMGIFDVSMYPLYSEGRDRAFLRLEEEIDKASQREKEPGSRKHTNDDDHEVPVRKRLKVETHLRLDHDQVAKIMESLKYDQIEARQLNIKAPHSKTCKWIVDKTEFVSWQDFTKPCGILWIKGKPGSGKSTLMKYLLVYARRHIKVAALLSFFFNARGSDLEKSTNGAYRTLLVQLLDKIPTLQSIFDSLGPLAGSIETSHHWTTEVLKNLLIEAVQSLQGSTIVCLVDALDECDVDDVRDMVSFFEELCEYARSANGELRICFASRHYPHITIDTAINLIFEGQEGHQEDIERYLKSKLRIHDADVAEKARALLLERASGIFMWIVLVVDMLNKDYDRGREAEIEQRISNTPKDLHGLFHDMLTRDEHGKGYLLLCLQWVLFSKRPLKLAELYFAIQSTTSQFNASLRKASDTTMERFILDVSKGLVELTKTKSPVVQFIHESVRDYLLKTQALKVIWPQLSGDVESQSHEQLKVCCHILIMTMNWSSRVNGTHSFKANSAEAQNLRKELNSDFPLLEYATNNLLYHANRAAEGGIDQVAFIRDFSFTEWCMLHNIFEKFEVRRYTPNVSMLYIFAEYDLSYLIERSTTASQYLMYTGERYGPPLFAGMVNKSAKVVRLFMQDLINTRISHERWNTILDDFFDGDWTHGFGRDFHFTHTRTLYSYLVEYGHEILFELAYKYEGVPTVEASEKLLFQAVEGNCANIVRTICSKEHHPSMLPAIEINLQLSILDRNQAVVKALIESYETHKPENTFLLPYIGIRWPRERVTLVVNRKLKQSSVREISLALAAIFNLPAVINALIEEGVDVNCVLRYSLPGTYFTTPPDSKASELLQIAQRYIYLSNGRSILEVASRHRNLQAVDTLLGKGANPNLHDTLSPPLYEACKSGDEKIVRSLLKYGAKVYTSLIYCIKPYGTSLIALTNGQEQIVQLLLDKGAEQNAEEPQKTDWMELCLELLNGVFTRDSVAVRQLRKHVSMLMLEEEQEFPEEQGST